MSFYAVRRAVQSRIGEAARKRAEACREIFMRATAPFGFDEARGEMRRSVCGQGARKESLLWP
ncbi:MAG: hypothetical protein Kow00133_11190 [Amphiplicatus sp.]